ncbi:MAG TPA: formate dehydrogenase subunit alpha [Blastocatellia bacterium]|nr:formate dehydrogenase subunit alpha [Blastocatellia bacterium]
MLRATINYRTHDFAEGLSILDALHALHIEVPTLCHDSRLKACGSCRMCLVSVQGTGHPVPACTTALADGMVIETHAPELENTRRTLLRELIQHYPAAAVEQFPEKPFHRWLRHYGVEGECEGAAVPALSDDSHPYIHADMSQCITCYRCVRICREVQGQFVWREANRGAETRIVPDSGTTLRASSCVSCGACVDTCPTGALEDKSLLAFGVPTAWTKTTCPYCGTGCEMNVGTRDGRIVTVRPAPDAPVNKGHLCVKGRYAHRFVYASDRVTAPMILENGDWRKVSWDEAIAFTAERLKRIIERDGPDSIGVLGSARATNEENYVTQKFARVVAGTNNVDCCARVCHAPTAAAMKLTLGTGAATNSYDDIERAATILVIGCNPTENHPIIGARIKQAVLKGARLIVIDPRRIELADYADHHLPLRPGTNVVLLNALACAIVDEGLADDEFISERVSEWPEFYEFIQQYAPEKVAAVCGVDAELIRQAARLYATHKPALSVHGLGMTEHVQGTEGVMALVNLALLTGNIGKPGTGINPLRGQNNVQGSAHMGCEPGNLTGFVPLSDGRELFERQWRAALPVTRGLNLMQMMDEAAAGRLKALWTIGYDVLLTNASAHTTREAMRNLELVIVQDLFLNETAKEFGTVFLPAASSFEKDGTFMNAERRIQRVRKVIEPVSEAKSDWEIVCEVARAMGRGEYLDFHSAEEIWNEVRTVWKAGSGISYQRIEQAGLQWPCPSEAHPGTTILHAETFPVGRRAALRRIEYHATPETTNADYPFLLVTGRTLYQFNAGTMTLRTENAALHPTDYLDIAPADAERLKITDGERVRVRSRYGEAVMQCRLDPAVKPGELFSTFHVPEVFLNNLTSPYRDGYVNAPEYKVTAVRLEKAG